MELRIRPKSNFLHKASIEELHQINLKWLSELELWKDEFNFFQNLIDKYILKMISEDSIGHIQKLVDEIINFTDMDYTGFKEKLTLHEKHLEDLEENIFSHDEQQFRDEHSKLEDELISYFKHLRTFKQEVFEEIEKILKNEKFQHLLAK